MAQVPQSTLRYLYYDVLKVQPYRDPNRTYSDLVSTLQKYAGITVKGTKEYVHENGRPELLLYLGGVLPASFRGTLYHFPIVLWIPYSYPYDAPLIYVDPSEDIVVNPGQHVAPDGKIYHSYLAHWRDTWDRSNIVDFLSILADVFAKEPPVRSKPRQPILQQQGQHPPPPPRPPLPHEAQHPSSSHGHGAPPPPPPKEPAHAEERAQSPAQPRPGRYDAPLPLPPESRSPRPTSMHQQQRPQAIPQPRPTSQYMPQRSSSLRQSHPSQQWQQQPQPNLQQPYRQGQQYHSQNSYQSPPPQQQQQQQQQPQQQQPQPGMYPPQQQQYGHQAPSQPQPQPPKQPAPDLLDSPFDLTLPATTSANLPAPPIPRNPEKDALLSHLSATVTTTLHNLIAQNQSKLVPLQSQQSALQQSQHTLSSELSQLQALHATLTSNISDLQTSLSKADHTIADAKTRSAKGDIPSVDGMLITPHIVSTQLYNVTAEERGIEAAILALQEAFTRGRVGSEVWSKKTRELAREEFRKRWVGRKVGRGMSLDGA